MEELQECIDSLNRELLILEQDASLKDTQAAMMRALRTAHNLKGASRVVQLEQIEEACHTLEEVLVTLRENEIRPDLAMMQTLFATVDGMLHAGRLGPEQDPEGVGALPAQVELLRQQLYRHSAGLAIGTGETAVWKPRAATIADILPATTATIESDAALDALLVALYRDLGRWQNARHKMPIGTDSARFLEPLRPVSAELQRLASAIDKSIAVMSQAFDSRLDNVPAEPDLAGQQERGKVLVIDDSRTMRSMQRATLEQLGCLVTTSEDGFEGLQIFERDGADLIVVDVEMPVMDGYGFVQSVRTGKRQPDVPIVMVTGLDSPEHRARGLALGADYYVVKGVAGQRQLVSIVDEVLPHRPPN